MLDGPIVDVAIGLIFFYVVLSLVCSAVQELVASVLGLRSRNLRKGIHTLLGCCYAQKLYKHSLIKHLAGHGKDPSYVRPSIFAAALVDVVGRGKDEDGAAVLSPEQVHAALEKMDGKEPVRGVLLALSRGSDESLDELRTAVADWYEEAMDRVAGWYKRRVQWTLLIIAGVVTVAVNADTMRVAEELWDDDALRAAVVARVAEAEGTEDLKTLKDELGAFPLGYPKGFCIDDVTPEIVIGWLLTMAAISLGAPFWFDLLGKVSHLRGSGTREADRARKPGPEPPATPAVPATPTAPATPNAEGGA